MQLLSLCDFIGSAHIPAELCLLVSPFTRPSFPIFRWGARVREGCGGSGDETNNILCSHQTLLPPSPLTPPTNCREGSGPRETSIYQAHPSFLAYIFDDQGDPRPFNRRLNSAALLYRSYQSPRTPRQQEHSLFTRLRHYQESISEL